MPDLPEIQGGHVYRGPVAAVIFDWAGTILDFGCMAPIVAFRRAFAECGLEITEEEARKPMGAAKREHIEMILADSEVKRRWFEDTGSLPSQADGDRIYAAFLRVDGEISEQFCTLIPGALDCVAALRSRGIAIGSTTGYPRSIMDRLMPLAAAQGYAPDCCVTVSEVKHGRPWPDMLLHNVMALDIRHLASCVVVDDSPSGLVAARSAGMWAVGIAASGNEVGLSEAEWSGLEEEQRSTMRAHATNILREAGAHYVVDTVADLLPIMDAINDRLAAGERD